jgi:hypothetical protein
MHQKIKRLTGIILLTIFVCYYANICFFYHGHIVNGVTIVHSHFHDRAHTQTNSHTASELTLISILSLFQSCPPALLFVGLCMLLAAGSLRQHRGEPEVVSRPVPYCSLRAPPATI